MAGPIVVSGRWRDDGLSAGVSRSEGRFRSLGRVASAAGRASAIGLGVATAAAVKLGQESAREASAAQQSIGATRSVYGRYADTIIRESRRADTALGLSQNEYRELSNQLGAMLSNTGSSMKVATDRTVNLTKRGADMAATFGGTTREAVEAIGAALRGETDPIERYGVSIREADIAARLAATGQDALTGSALKQAQAQARVDLILQQTSKTAGQFGREQNTLAGQQERLGAQVDNLQAKLGRQLLPVLTDLTRYGNREVVPFLSRMVDQAASGEGRVGAFADGVRDVVDGIRSGRGEYGETADGLKEVGGALADAWPEIKAAARELPSLSDGLKVGAVAIKFAADNADTLTKALPLLVSGFVAFKVAQAAANVATAASPALRLADTLATRQQTRAIRELAAAQATSSGGAALVGGRGARGSSSIAAVGRDADTAASKVSRLGRVSRVAGGVAGVGALAAGAVGADGALGTLASVGGGAMLGFAAGGPIGAAIGAAGGLLTTLGDNASKASEKAEAGSRSWKDYAGTLDQVTGAATEATGAMAFQSLAESGSLSSLRQLGITNRDAVNAILGRGDASARVSTILGREQSSVDRLRERTQAYSAELNQMNNDGRQVSQTESDRLAQMESEVAQRQRAIDAIKEQTGEAEKAAGAVRRQAAATRDFTGSLKGIPRDVRTEITAGNIEPTRKGIKDLIREHDDLGRKRVRTLVRAAGLADTDRDVRRLADRLLRLGRQQPNLRPYQRGLTRGVRAAENGVGRAAQRIRSRMVGPPNQARTNLNPYTRSVIGGLRAAERVGGTRSRTLARTLERNTERASPNLRSFTADLGRDLANGGRTADRGARGIADDLRRGTGRARPDLGGFTSGITAGVAAGRGIASSGGFGVGASLKSAVISGFSGTGAALAASAAAAVTSAINAANAAARNRGGGGGGRESAGRESLGGRVGRESAAAAAREAKAGNTLVKALRAAAAKDLRSVQDRLKALGAEWKRDEERVNRVTAALGKQSKRLVTNAKNIERNTRAVQASSERLKEAKRIRDEYAASVRSGALEFGSLTGIEETHLNSPAGLLAAREELLARQQRFDAAIRELRGKLNNADLKALVDAGAGQGLAAAEALAGSLGDGTVKRMNEIQAQLSTLGGQLGKAVANDLYQGTIQARAKALRADQRDLKNAQKTGTRLASRLLSAFRNQLGGPKRQAAESLLRSGAGTDRLAQEYGARLAKNVRTGASREAATRTSQARQRAGGAGGQGQAGGYVVLTAKDVSDVLAGRQVKKLIRAADKAAGKG